MDLSDTTCSHRLINYPLYNVLMGSNPIPGSQYEDDSESQGARVV